MHGNLRHFRAQLAWARLRSISPWRLAIFPYVAIAIFTFGVSASDFRVCVKSFTQDLTECTSAQRAGAGFAAGIFWPLYWSWTAAEYIRGPVSLNTTTPENRDE